MNMHHHSATCFLHPLNVAGWEHLEFANEDLSKASDGNAIPNDDIVWINLPATQE